MPWLVWRGLEPLIWLACVSVFVSSVVLFSRGVDPRFYEWWQSGSFLGFLPYWWLGVLFVNPVFAESVRRRVWVVLVGWAVMTSALCIFDLPATLAIAEVRKLCFAILVGVLVAAADGLRLPGLGGLTLAGRAGYSIYALHAPLVYTLAIYRVPWWLNIAANILAGLAMHLLIEGPLIDVGRAIRFKIVRPLSG
jgi:hypothetical protein